MRDIKHKTKVILTKGSVHMWEAAGGCVLCSKVSYELSKYHIPACSGPDIPYG